MEIDRWTIVSYDLTVAKKHRDTYRKHVSAIYYAMTKRYHLQFGPTPRYALSTPFFHEMPLRWINNTIGLHNHREFVIMVGTLLLIAFLGMGIDLVLLSSFLRKEDSNTKSM